MIKLHHGDCREVLAQLEAESVQCVVTSPPYFGLRDYCTATWDGGDTECDHLRPAAHGYDPFTTSTLGPKRDGISAENSAHADGVKRQQFGRECGKCGAQRIDRQIGLEQSPAEYAGQLVEVFRDVRRVLRTDGCVFLNLGDSYAGSWGNQGRKDNRGTQRPINGEMLTQVSDGRYPAKASNTGKIPPGWGLKPKDLMMIPARVAIALQDDGWWIRSDIIWSKPNPMPESVTDRPTKSHEYVFLLTKSERYFYDAKAIAEPAAYGQPNSPQSIKSPHGQGYTRRAPVIEDGRKDLATATYERHRSSIAGGQSLQADPTETRNARSVWTIATAPYAEAHFATFPPALAERCIKAGSKPGDTVLDPFAGAGTTLLVADRLQRHGVGIELNPDYCGLIRSRLAADAPLLTEELR